MKKKVGHKREIERNVRCFNLARLQGGDAIKSRKVHIPKYDCISEAFQT